MRRWRCRPGPGLLGATGLLLVLAAGYLWLLGGPTAPVTARIGGPFALTDGIGRRVTDRDFRGRFMLIYFGYTTCPDVCPTTLAAVEAALHQLGTRARRVAPLFITVDPARDTPDVVERYVRGFGTDLIGLTGTPAEIARVRREYLVSAVRRHDPDHGGAIDHTAVLLLIGPDGRYVAPLPVDAPAAGIAARLDALLS